MTRPVCLAAPRRPDHCWHLTGDVLTHEPLQWEEVCCYCDARRAFTPPSPDDYCDHGPHHPARASGLARASRGT